MEYSGYQAAALYDFTHHMRQDNLSFPVTELVIDADRCALGICRCDEGGGIALLEQAELSQPAPLDQLWLEQIAAGCGVSAREAAGLPDEAQAQTRLWNYYCAGRRSDAPAFSLPDGRTLCCSQLDAAFAPVQALLDQLLEQGLQLLERLHIPEEQLRILTVGRMADCAPVRLTLRGQLCFDPFLPDDRFVALRADEDPGRIVEEGMRLHQQTQMIGIELDLLCTDASGAEEVLCLARSQQLASALSDPHYCPPVFVSASEPLRFRTGGRVWEQPLPYAIGPLDGDLVEAACVVRAGRPLILLRRTLAPTRVYEVQPQL